MPRTRPLLRLLLAQEHVLLGGQAVLEGVMMRSPQAFAVAVRKPDGAIALLAERVPMWTRTYRALRLPVLRGAATLVQSLALGVRALNFSSAHAFPEEPKPGQPATPPAATDAPAAPGGYGVWLSLALAMAMAVGLFFLLPLALTEAIRWAWPQLGEGLAFNLVDGLIRGVIFLAYIGAISLVPDIKRLFRYHGAEHKVVHAFEAGGAMDVPTVQGFTTLHPRCGTSFLLFVMVVAILVFALIPPAWGMAARIAARIVLIPVIAGVSFEAIRFSARHRGRAFARLLMAPGLWLQKITTGPPDDEMVEVALAAFRRASDLEGDPEALVL